MPGIDSSRQFVPLKIAVLTISDTRALEDDKSGATLIERIEKAGHALSARAVVPDEIGKIRAQVERWIADPAIDVVITTGGDRLTRPRGSPEAQQTLLAEPMRRFPQVFLFALLAQS